MYIFGLASPTPRLHSKAGKPSARATGCEDCADPKALQQGARLSGSTVERV